MGIMGVLIRDCIGIMLRNTQRKWCWSWQAVEEAYGEMAAAIDSVPSCIVANASACHVPKDASRGLKEALPRKTELLVGLLE